MAPPSNSSDMPKGNRATTRSNLASRTISALVLVPVVATAIWLGGPWFDYFVILFAGLMAWEWARISGRRRNPADPAPAARLPVSDLAEPGLTLVSLVIVTLLCMRGLWPMPLPLPAPIMIPLGTVAAMLVAFGQHRSRAAWFGLGYLYVTIPTLAILYLRDDPVSGMGLETMAWALALVIATDTGAYAAGRSLGGPKLAPRISPSKTWSGLGGGMACAALVGLVVSLWISTANIWFLMILSGSLAIVAQMGDLFESAFKRHFGVKDSSHIIPGHGGVLDRVDGLLTVSVAVALLNYFGKGSVLSWL